MELESEILPTGNPDSEEKQHALANLLPLRRPATDTAVGSPERTAPAVTGVEIEVHA
jgi:hypothetical protein